MTHGKDQTIPWENMDLSPDEVNLVREHRKKKQIKLKRHAARIAVMKLFGEWANDADEGISWSDFINDHLGCLPVGLRQDERFKKTVYEALHKANKTALDYINQVLYLEEDENASD